MALMLAICSPQPNRIRRNPKLMFQICQKLFCGYWHRAPLTQSGRRHAGERTIRHCTPFAGEVEAFTRGEPAAEEPLFAATHRTVAAPSFAPFRLSAKGGT